MNIKEFGVNLDIKAMLEQDMVELDKFSPPNGRLLLAQYKTQIAGCACMEKIAEDTGGIKRMFVRQAFREKGIGRALLESVIDEARKLGSVESLVPKGEQKGAEFVNESQRKGSGSKSGLGRNMGWKI